MTTKGGYGDPRRPPWQNTQVKNLQNISFSTGQGEVRVTCIKFRLQPFEKQPKPNLFVLF